MANTGTLLPSSPLSLCEDRFSLLPSYDDSPLVPTWPLIFTVITLPTDTVDDLIDHLETLAICLRGKSGTDYDYLRHFLHHHWDATDFLDRVYPSLVRIALDLPLLFPSGVLPVLSLSASSCTLTRKQIACLVVHQFLCTQSSPSWLQLDGSPNFHIWYGSEPPHPRAAHAYLFALFTYFDRLATASWITNLSPSEWPITLTLCSAPSLPSSDRPFSPLTIHAVPTASTDPSFLGIPSGACVVSANKYIGFGRTGTQEETQVGCSPEACPALLFVPPLQDDQVLILEGVEAMISMKGYGREASLDKVLTADYDRETYRLSSWRHRAMLLMDALELDLHDASHGVVDLLPGHVDRELTKAYTAFATRKDAPYSEVVTGLWGCRAFGGNPEIKTVLQWCAASLAGVPLTFVCDAREGLLIDHLKRFSSDAIQYAWTVCGVLSSLRSLRPEDEGAKHAFDSISAALAREGKSDGVSKYDQPTSRVS